MKRTNRTAQERAVPVDEGGNDLVTPITDVGDVPEAAGPANQEIAPVTPQEPVTDGADVRTTPARDVAVKGPGAEPAP